MFIFTRHGETVYNVENRFQGVSDSALTQKGIVQAKRIHEYIKNYTPLRFYASPLPRALQTQMILSQKLQAPLEIVEELAEVCYGEWEEQKKETLKQHPLWELKKKDKFNFIHPGKYKNRKGESYKDLYNRIELFLNKLMKKPSTENAVIISHIGVMRCVYKYFNHSSDIETGNMHIPNNQIFRVEQKQDHSFSFNSILL